MPCEENVPDKAVTEEKYNNEKDNDIMNTVIKVEGMMCPHCEARVKKVCEAIDGVVSAVASHTDGTVTLEMTRDARGECEKAIADAGYDVV